MNKLLVATMVALVAGVSQAESSLSLYGVVDAGLQYKKERTNSAKVGTFGFSQDNVADNRFGLKGVEDLGTGTSIIFNLEGGFSVINGASNDTGLFGRRAIVGLDDKDYGVLTIGLQKDVADHLLNGDVMGVLDFDQDKFGKLQKRETQIRYVSPNMSGIQFGASYGTGDTSAISHQWRVHSNVGEGRFFSNDHVAVALAYHLGDLKVSTAVNVLKYNTDRGEWVCSDPSNYHFEREVSAGAEYDFLALKLGVRFQHYERKFHTAYGPNGPAWLACDQVTNRDLYPGVDRNAGDYYWGTRAKRYEITMAMPLTKTGTLYTGIQREVMLNRIQDRPTEANPHAVDWLKDYDPTNRAYDVVYFTPEKTRTTFVRLSYVEQLNRHTSAYIGYGFKYLKHLAHNFEEDANSWVYVERAPTITRTRVHYWTLGLSHRF